MKNFLFNSLFLVNLRFSFMIFCVFLKYTMLGIIYLKNEGLEWFPNDVGFIPNLSFNVRKNLSFIASRTLAMYTGPCMHMHTSNLHMHMCIYVRSLRISVAFIFQKQLYFIYKRIIFFIKTFFKSIHNLIGPKTNLGL